MKIVYLCLPNLNLFRILMKTLCWSPTSWLLSQHCWLVHQLVDQQVGHQLVDCYVNNVDSTITKKVTNPNFLLSLSFSFFSQLVQWFAWLVGFRYFSFCLCKVLRFFSSGICKIICIFLLVYAKTSTLLTLFLLYIPLQAGDHPPQKTNHFRLLFLLINALKWRSLPPIQTFWF